MIPLLRQLGYAPELVLSRVGLPPDALDDPDQRVPFTKTVALLDAASKVTGCDHFGLLVGRMSQLADLGSVGTLAGTARDVGEALEMVTVYQHLNSGGGLVFMLRRAGMVDLGYAVFHPAAGPTGQIHDAMLGFAMNVMRELCGPGWAPTEVFLPHAKPASHALFRTVFKTNVRFDAETCALRFPETWLAHRLDRADADKARAARAACGRALEQQPIVERVHRALRLVMLHGDSSGDAVAQALSMHRRTLNRRLCDAGLTFQQVLDDVRFAVAREFLEGSRLSLDDVAATVGYAGVSPFMRAFHRWSGHTAGEWRRAAQRGQPFTVTSDGPRREVANQTRIPATRPPAPAVAVPFVPRHFEITIAT